MIIIERDKAFVKINKATFSFCRMTICLLLCFLVLFILPAKGSCEEDVWNNYNRSISLKTITLIQDYTETDIYGLTANGILDAEEGDVPGWGVNVRWQGKVVGLPLWVQADYLRLKGETDYQGYLQSSNVLTPFSVDTDNTFEYRGLTLGIPLPLAKYDIQFVPYTQVAEQSWKRDLVDVKEYYRYRGVSLGVLGQWRFSRLWTFEAIAQTGRLYDNHLDVRALDFSADLDNANQLRVGLGLNYQIADNVSIGGHWSHTNWENRASDIINGFQEPPSKTRQEIVDLSLNLHY